MDRRVAFINAVPYGSTVRIVLQLAEYGAQHNWEPIVFFSWAKKGHQIQGNNIYSGTFLGRLIHMTIGRLFGLIGFMSILDTLRVIHKLKAFKPDVINLHILHAWSFNLPILFRYIKAHNIPVVWTMHDCWAVTGHCPHFTLAECSKWTTGCHHCPQHKLYPASMLDVSTFMWNKKRAWFSTVPAMRIITPSRWLQSIMKQSFLKDYEANVIYNGIDLDVFKPTSSDFRVQNGIDHQFLVLGVAFDWGYRKGLDVMKALADLLDDRFKIVLVGVNETIRKELPSTILAISKTQNVQELAQIYSAADLFVNPTREEVLGMVNIEALACGTPVLAFNTGGTPECFDSTCGRVTPHKTAESMAHEILNIYAERPFSSEDCVKYAQKFSKDVVYPAYYNLFEEFIAG